MSTTSEQARWDRAMAEHAAAIDAFGEAARELPEAHWNQPRAEGKWSPAQIAEHLRLTYATLGGELRGETGFRLRVGKLRMLVLRLVVLRRLLRDRAFPRGAPATREVRPGAGPFEREAVLAAMRVEAETFARDLAERRHLPSARLTHPFFGKLDPLQGLDICALHVGHHRAQLRVEGPAATAARGAGAAAEP